MRINNEILQIAKRSEIPVEKILKVAFALHVAREVPSMLREYLNSSEITDAEVEHIYRINLFEYDGMSYSLKIPLFVTEGEVANKFDEFWQKLVGKNNQYGLNSRGHIGNQKSYAPLSKTDTVQEAFYSFVADKDMDRACEVIASYYREIEACKKLDNYLKETFLTDYEVYEKPFEKHVML